MVFAVRRLIEAPKFMQHLALLKKQYKYLRVKEENLLMIIYLTLRRPKQHRAQAPDVPDLAQTVKPWSDLFKIFRNVFAGA